MEGRDGGKDEGGRGREREGEGGERRGGVKGMTRE